MHLFVFQFSFVFVFLIIPEAAARLGGMLTYGVGYVV